MKRSKAIFVQIVFYILFAFLVLAFVPNSDSQKYQSLKDCRLYEDDWKAWTKTTNKEFEKLPVFYEANGKEQDLWISKKLEDISDYNCIGFFSFQQQVEVYLNDKKIYSFVPEENTKSTTPGNKWNFIPLKASDEGSKITIHIFQCYNKGRITIPDIYIGTQSGILINYLADQMIRLYVSIAMIFVGILIGFFVLMKGKNTSLAESLKWLALFAIFRGIWGYIESNTYSYFTSRLLLISQLSYMSLKIAVPLFLQFINELVFSGKNKKMRALCVISIGEFFVTTFLQFAGICDFATTIFVTHGILLFGGIYSCISIAYSVYQRRNNSKEVIKMYSRSISAFLCTVLIIISSLIDMFRYYTTNSPDVARFCRFGDIVFVLVMAFGVFKDFVYLLKMGQNAAVIKEQASLDSMTKLLNRTCYEKDINRGNKTTWRNRGIIVLDLNNLKYFNDKMGHDAGDQYIIFASHLIEEIFDEYGKVYRIGGDEFCVITKNLSTSKFEELREAVEQRMSHYKLTTEKSIMAIACGFAQFNPDIDESLHDTMKRADEEMYKRKKTLKEL